MKNLNIMIVGVGGQGSLLASKLLGRLFLNSGMDVKVSEVHGMSQRGGSVVTYVKCADKVYSPIIEQGEADVIISFEQLEAARWLPYLKKDGAIITNTQKIDPMPVIIGACEYPEEILSKITQSGVKVIQADALSLADKAGSEKAVNIVLLGIAAQYMDIDKELWLQAVKDTVPEKFADMNISAFNLGYSYK